MPSNLVKTKRDRELWGKAKKAAADQGHSEDWDYITAIFMTMKGEKKEQQRTDILLQEYFLREGFIDVMKTGFKKLFSLPDKLKNLLSQAQNLLINILKEKGENLLTHVSPKSIKLMKDIASDITKAESSFHEHMLHENNITLTIDDLIKLGVSKDKIESLQQQMFEDMTDIITNSYIESAESVTKETVSPKLNQIVKRLIKKSSKMFIFGFIDNFIMVLVGDFLDASLASVLGLSTMTAAGIGNALSDAVGESGSDKIESLLGKIGLNTQDITDEDMKSANWFWQLLDKYSSVLGVLLGCIVGMVPLLFTQRKFVSENKLPASLNLWVRKLKQAARKHNFKCSTLSYSPYSNSVYFYISGGKYEYPMEIRVSDHNHPNQSKAFKGYSFVVDSTKDTYLEELFKDFIEDLIEHEESINLPLNYAWAIDNILQDPQYSTIQQANQHPISNGVLMHLGKLGWEIIENVKRKIMPENKSAKRFMEKLNSSYEFSSTQVQLPVEISEIIKAKGLEIPDEDLYTGEDREDKDDWNGFGREDDMHITLKYGLDTADSNEVQSLIENEPPIQVTMGDISFFSTDDYDVMKYDVISEDLHKLNKIISDNLKCTDTFPEYKPHATVAYVKKGKARNLVENNPLKDKSFIVDEVVFSGKDGTRTNIKLAKGEEMKSKRKQMPENKSAKKYVKEQDDQEEHGEHTTFTLEDVKSLGKKEIALWKKEGFESEEIIRWYNVIPDIDDPHRLREMIDWVGNEEIGEAAVKAFFKNSPWTYNHTFENIYEGEFENLGEFAKYQIEEGILDKNWLMTYIDWDAVATIMAVNYDEEDGFIFKI